MPLTNAALLGLWRAILCQDRQGERKDKMRAQNISCESPQSNYAKASFCTIGTCSSGLIFSVFSILYPLNDIFGNISLMQSQTFSENIGREHWWENNSLGTWKRLDNEESHIDTFSTFLVFPHWSVMKSWQQTGRWFAVLSTVRRKKKCPEWNKQWAQYIALFQAEIAATWTQTF